MGLKSCRASGPVSYIHHFKAVRPLGSFAGAVMCLEDDDYRNERKANLNLPDDRGDPTWAIYFNRLFVAFKELEDRIDVVFVNRRSMFRPPFRP